MRNHPQRVAWATLLTGLIIFCAICAGSVQFVEYVLFEWPVALNNTVYVSRGTIGVLAAGNQVERPVRDKFVIDQGDRISTDELSQANLTIRDPLNLETVIASVQLLGGSEVRLKSATRPRFFGDTPFTIRLSEVTGDIEVVIAHGLERDVRMEVESNGRKVRLDHAGAYMVTADRDSILVTVQRGEALLVDRRNNTQQVRQDEQGSIAGNRLEVQPVAFVSLIPNSDFAGPTAGRAPGAPWGCRSEPPDPIYDEEGNLVPQPDGVYETVTFQGRPAVHIMRWSAQELNHAETLCFIQNLNLDVRQYDSLVIRVKMYLVRHDVSGCGIQASECVLMVRLNYQNQRGDSPQWIHGFFIHYDARGTGYPIRCSGCVLDHEHVNGGAWFTYESENLISSAPEQADLRPVILDKIQFDASGHRYEVYVSEVAVIAQRNGDQALPAVGGLVSD